MGAGGVAVLSARQTFGTVEEAHLIMIQQLYNLIMPSVFPSALLNLFS